MGAPSDEVWDLQKMSDDSRSGVEVERGKGTRTVPFYQEVFSNDLLLKEILNQVDAFDLKSYRLVNETWRQVATHVLVQKRAQKIRIEYYPGSRTYWVNDCPDKRRALVSLLSCIRRSIKFPCVDFSFNQVLPENRSLQKFFKYHGNNISTLRLRDLTGVSSLNYVFDKVPNLQHLAIYFLDSRTEDDLQNLSLKIPPRLRTLEVSYLKPAPENHRLFKTLLKHPSLNELKDFRINKLGLIEEVKRLNLIKNLHFDAYDHSLPLYLKFILLPIFLTRLDISWDFYGGPEFLSEASKALSRILWNSAETLKTLVTIPLIYFELETLPVFKKLAQICFKECDEVFRDYVPDALNIHMVFPLQFDFTRQFPNVSSVCFQGIGDRDVGMFFPQLKEGIPLLIKELYLMTAITTGEMSFLTWKLTGLTKLELRYTRLDCDDVNLWDVLPPTVTSLKLHDSTFFVVDETKRGILDHYFTRIVASQQGPLGFVMLEAEESSFSKLTNLRFLTFGFEQERSYTKCVWFTKLSGWYAFSLLPDLLTTFCYDMEEDHLKFIKKSLQPLKKFVTFGHAKRWPDSIYD